ncbi:hypothetical protein IG631_05978 [Alternaria alternata]|nr:hypothetical protein IG631_05978 [Alternaria alternata]
MHDLFASSQLSVAGVAKTTGHEAWPCSDNPGTPASKSPMARGELDCNRNSVLQ